MLRATSSPFRGQRCTAAVTVLFAVVVSQTGIAQPALGRAQPVLGRAAERTTPVCNYTVLRVFPHDADAFTQGLVYDQGELFEGTGLWGQSSLRRVDLETGSVLQIHRLSPEYFGEGITVRDHQLLQLTYQSQVAFVYDRTSFAVLGQLTYPTEGWGITGDDQRLIMSDGTAILRFRDRTTLHEVGQVVVTDEHGPVAYLNELELIHGEVLANVWPTDRIARIDPESGQVLAWIDLTGLLATQGTPPPSAEMPNGIAFDAVTERLFVTGKLWPYLFEIALVDCPGLGQIRPVPRRPARRVH